MKQKSENNKEEVEGNEWVKENENNKTEMFEEKEKIVKIMVAKSWVKGKIFEIRKN